MKSILIKLFFKEKFIGQIAAAIAAYAASLLLSILPNAPEFVTGLVAVVLQIPEGVELTADGVTAVLTPLIMLALNAIVQNLVAKDNNAALQVMREEGVYDGPLDSWVGPVAQDGIQKLASKVAGR